MEALFAKWAARRADADKRGRGDGPSVVARRARAERRLIEEFLRDLADVDGNS